MIKTLSINHFKSLVNTHLTLQPLTVFIGPNNAGKSNLFQALGILSNIVEHGISKALPPAIAQSYLYHHDRGNNLQFEVGAKTYGLEWKYQIDVQYTGLQKYDFQIANESLESIYIPQNILDQQTSITNTTLMVRVNRNTFQDLLGHKEITWINSQRVANMWDAEIRHQFSQKAYFDSAFYLLQGIQTYQFDPKILAAPAAIGPNPVLGRDGANLAAVLDSIRDQYPEQFALIEEKLRTCIPEADRITFNTTENAHKQISIRDKDLGKNISAEHLSEGILIFLALLTVIYSPQRPSVICIEEIEHGVHPRRLEQVLDFLTTLSYHADSPTQVLLTTHSPYVLDWFKERLEEVIITEKEAGKTHFTPLTERVKDPLNGTLGDLWYSGIFGGVPQI